MNLTLRVKNFKPAYLETFFVSTGANGFPFNNLRGNVWPNSNIALNLRVGIEH